MIEREWIKKIVEELASKIDSILIEEGQTHSSLYGFKLGDTIKFTPTQVTEIICNNWRKFDSTDRLICLSENEQLLPETEKCLVAIENLIAKYGSDYEDYEKASEKDKLLVMCPMLILAGVMYSEAKEWAVELAKHILALDNTKDITVHYKID